MDDNKKQMNIDVKQIRKELGMGAVQPDEFIEVIEVILAAIKELKGQIDENIAQNKGELSDSIKETVFELKDKEIKLEGLINKSKEFTLAEVRALAKTLGEKIDTVEIMIPNEVDIEPLQRKVEEIEKKMPKDYDDKTLKEEIEEIKNQIEELKTKTPKETIIREMVRGGGNVEVFQGNNKINSSQRIKFVGATVTVDGDGATKVTITGASGVQSVVGGTGITIDNTDPNNPIINATATGGGFTLLSATGIVNSVNAAFTFTEKPDYIISDGVWYRENKGWTWSVLTATMTIPPNDDIYGFT